ncbi:MAG: hypothetical protein ACXVR9_13495 [Gaiellaceae bacterium]
MATGAKEFRYAVALDRAGRVTANGHAPLDLDPSWTPEHLVLAGLVRCTLQSLRFHSDREGIDFVASAAVSGTVTKRPEDGRYAFVDLDTSSSISSSSRCRRATSSPRCWPRPSGTVSSAPRSSPHRATAGA